MFGLFKNKMGELTNPLDKAETPEAVLDVFATWYAQHYKNKNNKKVDIQPLVNDAKEYTKAKTELKDQPKDIKRVEKWYETVVGSSNGKLRSFFQKDDVLYEKKWEKVVNSIDGNTLDAKQKQVADMKGIYLRVPGATLDDKQKELRNMEAIYNKIDGDSAYVKTQKLNLYQTLYHQIGAQSDSEVPVVLKEWQSVYKSVSGGTFKEKQLQVQAWEGIYNFIGAMTYEQKYEKVRLWHKNSEWHDNHIDAYNEYKKTNELYHQLKKIASDFLKAGDEKSIVALNVVIEQSQKLEDVLFKSVFKRAAEQNITELRQDEAELTLQFQKDSDKFSYATFKEKPEIYRTIIMYLLRTGLRLYNERLFSQYKEANGDSLYKIPYEYGKSSTGGKQIVDQLRNKYYDNIKFYSQNLSQDDALCFQIARFAQFNGIEELNEFIGNTFIGKIPH